jgi:hypothetical protein
MKGLGQKPKSLSSNDNPLSDLPDINAKGPAEAATSPDHGSNIPTKDIDMNGSKPNTAAASAPAPSPMTNISGPSSLSRAVSEVEDKLATVRFLNEAIFLAAGGLATMEHTNAFQAICDEINDRLLFVRDRLDEIREELK